MNIKSKFDASLIEVPLLNAYAASLLEKKTNKTNYESILKSIKNFNKEHDENLITFEKDISKRQNSFSIPFAKNELDLQTIIANTPVSHAQHFKVYSDASNISLGYLVVRKDRYLYRDRPISDIDEDHELPEALVPAVVKETLETLERINTATDYVYGPEEGDAVMSFYSQSIELCCINSEDLTVEIFIIRSDDSNPRYVIKRRLALAMLIKDGEFKYSITLPAHQKMELHAASFEGHCVLIESSEFKLIFKVPDLLDSTQRNQIKIDANFVLEKLFGTPNPIQIPLAPAVAEELFVKFKWFSISEADDWFAFMNKI